MEFVRAWGLETEVLAGAVEVRMELWRGETLASPQGSAVPVGIPSREQSALVSPTAPACVAQDHLEQVLLAHLRTLGTARVSLGTEVVDVREEAGGIRAQLRDVRTRRRRAVRCTYLIGADGAHSPTRAALGIAMRGPDQVVAGASAVFRAPLWEVVGDRRYGVYAVTHPEAAGIFLPAGPSDRWIYAVSGPPGSEQAAHLDPATMARRIRLGSGVPGLRPRLERIGRARAGAQMADAYRRGRAFLVGDAAHRVAPRGGTGMNTAIGDGHDLGWKLAWVLRGWAREDLLESYEAERRPVAEHNVARSVDPTGTVRTAEQELHVDLGGRLPHVWLPGEGPRRSTLDLLGPGFTLLTGPRRALRDVAAAGRIAGRAPFAVRSVDAITARALGIGGGGALLARPDGVPVAWWAGATAQPPTAAMASATGLPSGSAT
jgi:2-polyprenyl-6-methoxyphenol hydroxylase-like FAD-dependent oxidoreductase